jgi:ABC-type multidrug transport system fused ATPase/permease subunit
MVCKQILSLLPRGNRKSLVGISLGMFMSMVLETFSIGLIVPVLTILSDPSILIGNDWVASHFPRLVDLDEKRFIIYGLSCLVLVYVVKTAFLIFFYWKQNAFSFSLCVNLSKELYIGYLRSPWTFHIKNNSAYLLRNIASEVNIFIGNIVINGLKFITEMLVLLGIGLLLVAIEPVGSVIVILIFGSIGYFYQKLTRAKVTYWGEQRVAHEGKKILQLQQGLGCVKEIKLLGREQNFLDLFTPHNQKSANSLRYKLFLQQQPKLFLEVIAVAGMTLLVIILLLRGQALDRLLPVIGLFAAAVFRLMPSVNRIIDALQNIHYGQPSVQILKSQLEFVRKLDKSIGGEALSFQNKIEFRDASFSYPDSDKRILESIHLEIGRGEVVGLIGSSGSGKTTLVDLLLGLLSPVHGKILVDDVDIDSNLAGWQKNLGYVQQSISLLDDSLLNNIAFGLAGNEIDSGLIDKAVKDAQLEDLIASMPEGLNTNIGERGVKLSGGQRQRLGIARALYRNPKVLVLDEATSALDTETEKLIMDAIYGLGRDKTIIIIAHRLSTVKNCDKVFRLEMGKLRLTQLRDEVVS